MVTNGQKMTICKICGKETDMPFHTCDRSKEPIPTPRAELERELTTLQQQNEQLRARCERMEKALIEISEGNPGHTAFCTIARLALTNPTDGVEMQ